MRNTRFTYNWLRDCKWYYHSLKIASLYRMVDLGYLLDAHVFTVDYNVRRLLVDSGYVRVSDDGRFEVSAGLLFEHIVSCSSLSSDYREIVSVYEGKGFVPVESEVLWGSDDFIVLLYLHLSLQECTESLDRLSGFFTKRIGDDSISESGKLGAKYRDGMSMVVLQEATQASVQAVTATPPKYMTVRTVERGAFAPTTPAGYELLGVHDLPHAVQYWYHNAPDATDTTFTHTPPVLWGSTAEGQLSLSMLYSGLCGYLLPGGVVHKVLDDEGYTGNISVVPITGYQSTKGNPGEFYPVEDLTREYPGTFRQYEKRDWYGSLMRLREIQPVPGHKISVDLFSSLITDFRLSSKPFETGRLLDGVVTRSRSLDFAPHPVSTRYDMRTLGDSFNYLFPSVIEGLQAVAGQVDPASIINHQSTFLSNPIGVPQNAAV